MAGKRTFKPTDWMTSDSDGWDTQREFSRRELGERHPFASLYAPRWLFWLTKGFGWLKIGLALFALWALGHGGIPVVSDLIQWVGEFLWYLIKSAGQEVWSYMWPVVETVGGWLASVVVIAIITAVYGIGCVVLWRWLGWEFRMYGVGSRLYTVVCISIGLLAGLIYGVCAS